MSTCFPEKFIKCKYNCNRVDYVPFLQCPGWWQDKIKEVMLVNWRRKKECKHIYCPKVMPSPQNWLINISKRNLCMSYTCIVDADCPLTSARASCLPQTHTHTPSSPWHLLLWFDFGHSATVVSASLLLCKLSSTFLPQGLGTCFPTTWNNPPQAAKWPIPSLPLCPCSSVITSVRSTLTSSQPLPVAGT